MTRIKKRFLDESGSETVEFVMILPVLMLIMSYIVCFSQLFYANQIALTASDIGARVAITQYDASTALMKAHEASTTYINGSGMGISFESDNLTYSTWNRGEICDYSVTISLKTAMPMPGAGGFGSKQTVTRSGHMMIEKERY